MKSEVLRVNLRTLPTEGRNTIVPDEVNDISSALYLSRCRARLYLPELSGKRAYDPTLVVDKVAMVRGRMQLGCCILPDPR